MKHNFWLLCPWNSPGKNTGVGYHSPLQGIVLIQGSNPSLPHFRLLYQGNPFEGEKQSNTDRLTCFNLIYFILKLYVS